MLPRKLRIPAEDSWSRRNHNWNWILSRRVYILVPHRFNKHIWALLPENLTRAHIDIVFQYLSNSQIIFSSAKWRKWLNGSNSKNKKFTSDSAVLLHCVGLETLLLKVRWKMRRTWELISIREITRRWIHSHQEELENFLILALRRKCQRTWSKANSFQWNRKTNKSFILDNFLLNKISWSIWKQKAKLLFPVRKGIVSYCECGKITCILFNLILNRTETHETEHARCSPDWRATLYKTMKKWQNS